MDARSIEENPSPEVLRKYTEAMPNAYETEFGNLDVITRVTARSKNSTFIVSDEPDRHTDPTISRADYEAIAAAQDAHLRGQDLIAIDGYIGDHPDARVPTRLYVEKAHANLAAKQQILYFEPDDDVEPEFTVIYTPTLAAPGYPDDRIIAVDLDAGVTRVLNSDYFGESKMGGLRMWDALQYRKGGLAMHAGMKVIEKDGRRTVALVVGLSGTGKTTTTFSDQGDRSYPVQDDFIALYPGGRVYGTEAGTFAKTYGLTPESEPRIWAGVRSPRSYLENVAVDEAGRLDFFDASHTSNGRAVISADDIPGFLAPREVDTADMLFILTRSHDVVPAVAKLDREQAAAYFMLGETTGTSAGGKAEEGRFLRVPGTNPFFAYRHEWQANRFYELLGTHPLEVFLINTGRVGGGEGDERSKDLTPAVSSAIVDAIVSGTVTWTEDPDFGYLIAEDVPGIDDVELLQPRRLYERQGRLGEYEDRVAFLREDRRRHLRTYRDLLPEIAGAV